MDVKKILILRFSSLGDIIMATPLVRAVRRVYPAAQIDMAVRQDFIDLIKHNPHLDRKIGLPRNSGVAGLWRLKRDINREGYDLIYDAHRSLRTLTMMPMLRATHKAYFDKHYLRRGLAMTFKLRILSRRRTLERYIEPLNPYAIRYDNKGPEIFVDKAAEVSAIAKVPLPDLGPGERFIGIIPSAQWPGKRWPLENFRETMERLARGTSHRLIVFGGREDTFCDDLCRGLDPKRVVNAQGKLSLGESAALVKRCSLVISNDTGLMHVADALDIPSVLMLGPTSAEMGCLPFHPLSEVLEHDLWCRPCSKNGQAPCIRAKRYCLEMTTSDAVVAATMRVLKKLEGAA